jgi:hypothetical protein
LLQSRIAESSGETSSLAATASYEAYRAIDADPAASWLCVDRAPLPQTLTITLKQPRRIDYVELTQGTYHPAYNTRAYHVEYSLDGQKHSPCARAN